MIAEWYVRSYAVEGATGYTTASGTSCRRQPCPVRRAQRRGLGPGPEVSARPAAVGVPPRGAGRREHPIGGQQRSRDQARLGTGGAQRRSGPRAAGGIPAVALVRPHFSRGRWVYVTAGALTHYAIVSRPGPGVSAWRCRRSPHTVRPGPRNRPREARGERPRLVRRGHPDVPRDGQHQRVPIGL